jgi:hypothetical protein
MMNVAKSMRKMERGAGELILDGMGAVKLGGSTRHFIKPHRSCDVASCLFVATKKHPCISVAPLPPSLARSLFQCDHLPDLHVYCPIDHEKQLRDAVLGVDVRRDERHHWEVDVRAVDDLDFAGSDIM